MEWSEFTSFCVEAGFVATRRSESSLTYTFYHDEKYQDKTSKGDFIRDITYDQSNGLLYVVRLPKK